MKLTKEIKLKSWGPGEWVDEPDFLEFEHAGLKCLVIRVTAQEMNGSLFGGHLCGYVEFKHTVPEDPFALPFDVHGGITFGEELKELNCYAVGFDCAHLNDVIPSIEFVFPSKEFNSAPDKYKYLIEKIYKNIGFVESETRSLAEQVSKYDKEKLNG